MVQYCAGKGSIYEGAFRVPLLACWPGRIAAGRVSDHLGYFPDALPTFAELAGAAVPGGVDGLSFVPELIGEMAAGRRQPQHDYLYWERDDNRAIRQGNWRAVKPGKGSAWELYDLANDPSESKDLASKQPDLLAKLSALAERTHTPFAQEHSPQRKTERGWRKKKRKRCRSMRIGRWPSKLNKARPRRPIWTS